MSAAKARRVDVGRDGAQLLTGADSDYAYVSTTDLLSDAPLLHTPPADSAWPPTCAHGRRVILVRRAAVNGFECPTCSGSASAAADEPRLLVGKNPKRVGEVTFALDADARCACGDLIDDHPTMRCGFPWFPSCRAAAADEPGEQ